MPRKRRQEKLRRLPQAVAEIGLCERTWWQSHGPLLEPQAAVGDYTVWPDWATWATFYATVREELFRARPWRAESSAAEKLFAAIRAGDDPDAVRAQLDADRRQNDPRLVLER